MKYIKYITLFIVLGALLTSCFDESGTSILFDEEYVELDAATTPARSRTYTYLRRNDGAILSSGFIVTRSAQSAANAVNVNFEIQTTSTAIAGVHYTVSGSTVTIPSGAWTAELPISILPDNLEPGQVFTINVALTGGDLPVSEVYGSGSHRIQISCPSNLAGTYAFTTTNIVAGAGGNAGACGGSATGDVTIAAVSAGVYTVSDVSFGQFDCAWGDTPPGGTVRLNDICGDLSFTGVDKYGDGYTFTFVSNNGTNLVFDWINTYGDGGTTTLVAPTGFTWPSDLR